VDDLQSIKNNKQSRGFCPLIHPKKTIQSCTSLSNLDPCGRLSLPAPWVHYPAEWLRITKYYSHFDVEPIRELAIYERREQFHVRFVVNSSPAAVLVFVPGDDLWALAFHHAQSM
jgi:hypothetical protein